MSLVMSVIVVGAMIWAFRAQWVASNRERGLPHREPLPPVLFPDVPDGVVPPGLEGGLPPGLDPTAAAGWALVAPAAPRRPHDALPCAVPPRPVDSGTHACHPHAVHGDAGPHVGHAVHVELGHASRGCEAAHPAGGFEPGGHGGGGFDTF